MEVAIPDDEYTPLDLSEGIEELEAVLTKPALEAFHRLRQATRQAPEGIPPLRGYALCKPRDVDLLLSETIVSVGYEVDLEAAKAVIARLVDMVHGADRAGHIPVRKVRALLVAYYGDEGIPQD